MLNFWRSFCSIKLTGRLQKIPYNFELSIVGGLFHLELRHSHQHPHPPTDEVGFLKLKVQLFISNTTSLKLTYLHLQTIMELVELHCKTSKYEIFNGLNSKSAKWSTGARSFWWPVDLIINESVCEDMVIMPVIPWLMTLDWYDASDIVKDGRVLTPYYVVSNPYCKHYWPFIKWKRKLDLY